jgi:lipid II:glycine glycyltransferase (peptidoglycan interpeptide bridge formation enzyme)
MWQSLGSRNFLHLPIVEQKGKALAAAIVLQFKDTVYFEYSASDPDSLKLCPNQKLIWETIKLAHKDGARYFDFGRSSVTNSSLVEFKERWGARRCGLSYYYFPKAKRANTEHGAVRKMLEAVNRTLPCSLLQLEGKLIYPHLG